jgi:hypothetical protein
VTARMLAAAAALLALSGCAAQDLNRAHAPECRASDEIIIVAQSVPSASLLPCVESIPLGWTFRALEVRDGESSFSLESDRAGGRVLGPLHVALEVTLTPRCDVSGASEVPSDELAARQYRRLRSLRPYSGRTFYVFAGGCVVYDFDFRGSAGASLATEITAALSFVPREEVEEELEAADLQL